MTPDLMNLRRRARALGWSVGRSAYRITTPAENRGYRLIAGHVRDKSYEVLAGADFSLTLDDVARLIEDEERKRSAA